ncbi:DUF1993 family protein [Yoonia litorea]|uniref:DUF1993 domain-containing protein n=1 Tax=Yoonia litorea TaxID=1123755 RepID=A0A1I6MK21_9RHOB|nr:DUF1993 family protein [Yoonia litorea]SFS16014.1 hypothetical protein SAMN05444714_1941 [Yoonia litorea]
MFALAVPPVLQALTQAEHLLGKATDDMLSTRLAAGMFTCEQHFEVVASVAMRATYPLIGRQVPELPRGAKAALSAAREAVEALAHDDFDGAEARVVSHRAGFADLTQPAVEYLQCFALPNMWFHLAMVYAVLRQAGVDIGKADFDGLHAYPAGFRFDD